MVKKGFIIDQNKFFFAETKRKIKSRIAILATNQQSTGFASLCSLKMQLVGGGGGGGGGVVSNNNNFIIKITNKSNILVIYIAVLITIKIESIM